MGEAERQLLRDGYDIARQLASAVVNGDKSWASGEVERMLREAGLIDQLNQVDTDVALLGSTVLELLSLIHVMHRVWCGAYERDEKEAWRRLMIIVNDVGRPEWEDED